jgi:hypothetical protein
MFFYLLLFRNFEELCGKGRPEKIKLSKQRLKVPN